MNKNLKIKIFFIIATISLFALYSLTKLSFTQTNFYNNLIFSIRYEYFGMDAKKIEELITIPLENELFQLDNIMQIKSSTKLNQSITNITFNADAAFDSTYLQIRKITEKLSNELPKDVQNCQIFMSESTNSNLICVAFNCSKNDLLPYKQLFETINGVSEVIISGPDQNEISIEISNQKISQYQITPSQIIQAIQSNNKQNRTITINNNSSSTKLLLKTKLDSISSFDSIAIFNNKQFIPLTEIATISFTPKEKHEITLINNSQATILSIKTLENINIISISNSINKILKSKEINNFNPIIIYDKGNTQKEQLLQTFICFILILIFISAILYFFAFSKQTIFLINIIFLLSILWTVGICSILKISLTIESLHALIISIIIFSNYPIYFAKKKFSISPLKTNFQKSIIQYKKIFLSSICTQILILPFLFLKKIASQIFPILVVISLMNIFIFITSFLIIPIYSTKKENIKSFQFFSLPFIHKLNFNLLPSRFIFFCRIILLTLTIVLLFVTNKSTDFFVQTNIIPIYIDFSPERSIQSIQDETTNLCKEFLKIKGIKYIKNEITRGSCFLEIIPQNKNIKKLFPQLNNTKNQFANSNIYIPNQKKENQTIQLAVIGDDLETCQFFAKDISSQLSQYNFINQIVFNFKDAEKQYTLIPDKTILANANITVSDLAWNLRQTIYGSVITKLLDDNHETDVKLKTNNSTYKSEVTDKLELNLNNSKYYLNQIGQLKQTSFPPTINRLNSKYCAYLTLELKTSNSFTINKLKKIIRALQLPESFSISFLSESKSFTSFTLFNSSIVLSLLIIILLFIAIEENIKHNNQLIALFSATLLFPLSTLFAIGKPLNQYSYVGLLIALILAVNFFQIEFSNTKKLFFTVEKTIPAFCLFIIFILNPMNELNYILLILESLLAILIMNFIKTRKLNI